MKRMENSVAHIEGELGAIKHELSHIRTNIQDMYAAHQHMQKDIILMRDTLQGVQTEVGEITPLIQRILTHLNIPH
jgi:hypothetical protein